ncbi:MAG: cytochrome c family protein [Gammaproteobacteria bacterium]|nr:cytochrome c family protein [Gammaproteobacteria bacterium]
MMKVITKLRLFAALGGALLFAGGAAIAQPLHHTTSDTCKQCHQEIYKQWQGSMHANSTAFTDPIHATFYKNVVGDPGQEGVTTKAGKYPVCLQCHAPNAARDGKTKIDANPAYNEGVNCVACHSLKTFKGIEAGNGKLRLGIQAYELADAIQSPGRKSVNGLEKLTASNDLFGSGGGEQKPNPHQGEAVELDGKTIPSLPMESNPLMVRTSKNCMGCHDKRNNSHGVPLCNTGDEYKMSSSSVDCLACHMPINDGVADHSMGGGHDSAMLQRAVLFDLKGERGGDNIQLIATIKNLQPHSLPTGAPFRNIYMTVKAYDSEGSVIWSNTESHPAQDDKQAYLAYGLVDDEGKPTSPPKAKALGPDSRLKPFEERSLNYTLPAKGVVLVRGELHYNLLWPGLVKQFTHLPKDLTAPTLIAASEVAL